MLAAADDEDEVVVVCDEVAPPAVEDDLLGDGEDCVVVALPDVALTDENVVKRGGLANTPFKAATKAINTLADEIF